MIEFFNFYLCKKKLTNQFRAFWQKNSLIFQDIVRSLRCFRNLAKNVYLKKESSKVYRKIEHFQNVSQANNCTKAHEKASNIHKFFSPRALFYIAYMRMCTVNLLLRHI